MLLRNEILHEFGKGVAKRRGKLDDTLSCVFSIIVESVHNYGLLEITQNIERQGEEMFLKNLY